MIKIEEQLKESGKIRDFERAVELNDLQSVYGIIEDLIDTSEPVKSVVLDLVSNSMLNTKCTKCNHGFELTYTDHHSPHDTLKIGVGRDADVYHVEVECPKCENNETVY